MRHALLIAAMAGGVAAAIACSSSKTEELSEDGVDAGEDTGSVILGPDNKPAPTGPAGSGLATGLPCDVQAVIENRCIACHDGKMAGVPKMLDYADLLAPAKADPTKSIAQLSLERMKSATSPMPPPPAVPPDADEIAVFEEWVKGGTLKGPVCTEPPPADGGKADAGPLPDAGPDAMPGCASGIKWADGNNGSPLMHPGAACNACHQQLGGPNLKVAGTAYKQLNDVNDCYGAAPPPTVTVTITDDKGRKVNAVVNAAGNFSIQGGPPLRAPLSASLSDGTKTRAMVGKVTSGDCNSCHTPDGLNGAPGRILVP
jgi:mono/diheme cytochrome c family protein